MAAFKQDQALATRGTISGFIAGAIIGVGLFLTLSVSLTRSPRMHRTLVNIHEELSESGGGDQDADVLPVRPGSGGPSEP
jgi:hypothetical protein